MGHSKHRKRGVIFLNYNAVYKQKYGLGGNVASANRAGLQTNKQCWCGSKKVSPLKRKHVQSLKTGSFYIAQRPLPNLIKHELGMENKKIFESLSHIEEKLNNNRKTHFKENLLWK